MYNKQISGDVMQNRKTLDELYEQFCSQEKEAKKDGMKCMVFTSGMLFADFQPLFGLTVVPSLYYLFSFASNVLGPSFQWKKRVDESIDFLEFEKKFILLFNDLKQTLEKIGGTRPVELFSICYYLIRNGYLSIHHVFYAYNNGGYNFSQKSSIVAGYGVCRNLSPFFVDLLRCFDYESYNINMLLIEQEITRMTADYFLHKELEEKLTITEPILSSSHEKLLLLLTNAIIKYNHSATLLANGKESYIMDVMNETFYSIHDKKVYPFFNNEVIKSNLSKDKTNKRIPKVDSSDISDFDALVEEYLETREKCDGYRDTFERFYLEHKELYEEIFFEREEIEKKYEKILSLFIKK